MSKDLKVPYFLIAFTVGVIGLTGLTDGRSGMLVLVIIAGVFAWLGLTAGKKDLSKHPPA